MPAYSKHFYNHVHNKARTSAEEIVPEILHIIPAQSVIDVGCGTGDWLDVFSKHGMKDYLGVDGSWALDHLQIPREHFQSADLSQPLSMDRQYDLVVSLEVAEHLKPDDADTFIASLTGLGNVILFSAAIPMSGGTRHLNEQWPDYWIHKLSNRGFTVVDCLRKKYWRNPKVAWFYSQNMFLFVHKKALGQYPALHGLWNPNEDVPLSLVHPGQFLYMNKMNLTLSDIGKWLLRSFRRAIQKRFTK